MPGTVVPYERFLEIRQRRERVVAEPAPRPGSRPNGDSHDGEPPTIDCADLIDKRCGTPTQAAVASRQVRPKP